MGTDSFYLSMHLGKVLHSFSVAVPQLTIEGVFPEQHPQAQRDIALIPEAAISTAEDISREL